MDLLHILVCNQGVHKDGKLVRVPGVLATNPVKSSFTPLNIVFEDESEDEVDDSKEIQVLRFCQLIPR